MLKFDHVYIKVTDLDSNNGVYFTHPHDYYYFHFEDSWGNTCEVAEYTR